MLDTCLALVAGRDRVDFQTESAIIRWFVAIYYTLGRPRLS